MNCEDLDISLRWIDLAVSEHQHLPIEVLEHSESCEHCRSRLVAIRKDLVMISALHEGQVLPHSPFMPDPGGRYEPLPAELEATLSDIPRAALLGEEPDSKVPRALRLVPKSSSRFSKGTWKGVGVLLLAAAGLLLMIQLPKDGVIKGPSSVQAVAEAQPVALHLVRQGDGGQVNRLRLTSGNDGQLVLQAQRGEALLPVVQSPQVDLSAAPKYVYVLSTTEVGETNLYMSEKRLVLERLPRTAHMYVLPEAIRIESAGSTRLHVLLSDSPLELPVLEAISEDVLEGTASMEVR